MGEKISALPGASIPLAGTEVVPIVQAGVTRKVAVGEIAALAGEVPFSINVSFLPKPADNETLLIYPFTEDVTFPANFNTSKGWPGDNATASTVITLYHNPTVTAGVITGGTVAGTVTYSTVGAFTFASTGGTDQAFVAGEALGVAAQAVADLTATGAFTLTGERT